MVLGHGNSLLRTLLRTVLTAAAAVAGTITVSAGPALAALPADQLTVVTDHYLFDTSLRDFTGIRASTPYADQLDWSSDACSYTHEAPFGPSAARAPRPTRPIPPVSPPRPDPAPPPRDQPRAARNRRRPRAETLRAGTLRAVCDYAHTSAW